MEQINRYTEIIRSIGKKLIEEYVSLGHVDSGINGPYDDPETEVRNLSHLMVIASIEYLKYGKEDYLPIIRKMADEAMSMREPSGVYNMRQKEGKDQCNGVIGHAWLIEGLIYAYKVTKDRRYLEECDRIASMHEFQPRLGLWGRPLNGNSDEAIDVTLNHQLWYAYALFELNSYLEKKEYKIQCRLFLDCLNKNFKVNSNGRIAHQIPNRLNKIEMFKQIVKLSLYNIYEKFGKPSFAYKEKGYHLFNLMALAHIKTIACEHTFFKSNIFLKSINYLNTPSFIQGLLLGDMSNDVSLNNNNLSPIEKAVNVYGLSYNVPGFEILFVDKIFKNCLLKNVVSETVNIQFRETYDASINKFGLCVHDINTVNYRIYEYYQYLELL